MSSFSEMIAAHPLTEDETALFVSVYERALEDLAEMPDGYMIEAGFLARLACEAKGIAEDDPRRVEIMERVKSRSGGGVPVWFAREKIREELLGLGQFEAERPMLMDGKRRHGG